MSFGTTSLEPEKRVDGPPPTLIVPCVEAPRCPTSRSCPQEAGQEVASTPCDPVHASDIITTHQAHEFIASILPSLSLSTLSTFLRTAPPPSQPPLLYNTQPSSPPPPPPASTPPPPSPPSKPPPAPAAAAATHHRINSSNSSSSHQQVMVLEAPTRSG